MISRITSPSTIIFQSLAHFEMTNLIRVLAGPVGFWLPQQSLAVGQQGNARRQETIEESKFEGASTSDVCYNSLPRLEVSDKP